MAIPVLPIRVSSRAQHRHTLGPSGKPRMPELRCWVGFDESRLLEPRSVNWCLVEGVTHLRLKRYWSIDLLLGETIRLKRNGKSWLQIVVFLSARRQATHNGKG